MAPMHIVRPGECLTSIASAYGFSNYKTIYEHPNNAGFRRKRPDPDVIHPGDTLFIPPPEVKAVECATEATHRFRMHCGRHMLRLSLRRADGSALANEPYTLEVTGRRVEGRTREDGMLEEKVNARATHATLSVGGRTWRLAIAGLNPMEDVGDDVSGVQARLSNLGFDPGPLDGKLGPRTRAALREFQRHYELPSSGEITPELVSRLRELHGC